jgi:hypothetical protein
MVPRGSPLVAAALIGVLFLAGCLSPGSLLSRENAVPDLDLLPQAASLWPDHQNEPHPAFGWPTLTHPATGANVPKLWASVPNATLPASVTGLKHVAKAPGAVTRGGGTALFGSLAIVPGYGESSSIVDLSDPTSPQLLGQTEKSNVSHRGAATIAYPNGTLVAVFSTGYGMQAFDITNPAQPVLTADVHLARGHKLGVVPGTPIVYNANSRGGALAQPAPGVNDPRANLGEGQGQTEILDFSDPWNPVLVRNFTNGYGCHHIFFWIDAAKDKHRAICAGIQYTQLWDIKDPKDPKVIVSVPMHHGNTMLPSTGVTQGTPVGARLLTFSHTAMLNQDGTILIAGDEFQGGGGPAECDGVRTPAGDASGPLGNLWFYDVKDEKNPKLLGWISPPPANIPAGDTTDGCTAHHGRLVPDPAGKRQLLVMAWYKAGVVLVDFTDPTAPDIVDQWNQGANTWEAWYDNGWIVTGDLARGLDVLTLK